MWIEKKQVEAGPMFVLRFDNELDRDEYFRFFDDCVAKLAKQGNGDAFKRLVLKMKDRVFDKDLDCSSVLFADEVGVFILGLMDALRG